MFRLTRRQGIVDGPMGECREFRLRTEVLELDLVVHRDEVGWRLDPHLERRLREREVDRGEGTVGHPDFEEHVARQDYRAMTDLAVLLCKHLPPPRDQGREKSLMEQYGPNYAEAIDDLITGAPTPTTGGATEESDAG